MSEAGYSTQTPEMSRAGPWQRLVRWLSGLFDTGRRLDGRSAKQFLSSLDSTFSSIQARRGPDQQQDAISAEIGKILLRYTPEFRQWAADRVWDDAYKCERLMVNLFDARSLEVEISRRILDARNQQPELAAFYEGRVQKQVDAKSPLDESQVEINRSLLARLVDDIQWYQTQLYLKRGYAHSAQKRVAATFLAALILFAAVLFWTFVMRPTQVKAADAPCASEPLGCDYAPAWLSPPPGTTGERLHA